MCLLRASVSSVYCRFTLCGADTGRIDTFFRGDSSISSSFSLRGSSSFIYFFPSILEMGYTFLERLGNMSENVGQPKG